MSVNMKLMEHVGKRKEDNMYITLHIL